MCIRDRRQGEGGEVGASGGAAGRAQQQPEEGGQRQRGQAVDGDIGEFERGGVEPGAPVVQREAEHGQGA